MKGLGGPRNLMLTNALIPSDLAKGRTDGGGFHDGGYKVCLDWLGLLLYDAGDMSAGCSDSS